MGLLIYLIQYCYEYNTKEKKEDEEYEKYNICDPDYDGLELQDETIDGLEVYRIKEGYTHISADSMRCPLCTYHFPKEEEQTIQNKINQSNEHRILNIINSYHSLMRDVMEVDIFDDLKRFNDGIESLMSDTNNKRYYKHSCKRSDFQEIYIDIYIYPKGFNYKNLINKCYVYDNWCNNPQLKKELLKRRQEVHEEEIRIRELNSIYESKQSRKNTIEDDYKDKFNQICFEKEMSLYYDGEREIDRKYDDYEREKKEWEEEERRARDEWERERDRKREESQRIIDQKRDNGEEVNASDYYDENNDPFVFDKPKVEFDYKTLFEKLTEYMKYSETKRRIWEYIRKVYDERLEDRDIEYELRISNKEKEEFEDYIYDNDDEYRRVCKYLNSHSYPLKNEIINRMYI